MTRPIFIEEIPSFYNHTGDPLVDSIKKLGWGNTRFGLYFLFLIALVTAIDLAIYVFFWPSELEAQIDFIFRPTNIIFGLVVVPLIAGFYLWISNAPQELLNKLINSETFKLSKEEYGNSLNEFAISSQKMFSNRIWPMVAIIVGILDSLLNVLCTKLNLIVAPEGAHYWVNAVVNIPWIAIGIYMVTMIVIKGISTVIVVRKLFDVFPIKIYPWHPDRCGGLRPINNYALILTYIIATCGFGLGLLVSQSATATTLPNDFILWIGLVLYVFFVPYCFFGTLGGAHEAMKKEKEKQLKYLSEKFNDVYFSTKTVINDKDTEMLKIRVNEIEQLHRLYKVTEDFPVWPFDWGSIRRFTGALVGSLVPMIPMVVTMITNILQP